MNQGIALIRDRGADLFEFPPGLFDVLATTWDRFDAAWLFAQRVAVVVAAPSPEHTISDLESFRSACSGYPLLLLIPCGSSPEVMQWAAAHCNDFLLLPDRGCEMRARLSRLVADRAPGADREVNRVMGALLPHAGPGLIGSSPAFQEQLRRLSKMAQARAPVLITGETGTGKDVRPRHSRSERSGRRAHGGGGLCGGS